MAERLALGVDGGGVVGRVHEIIEIGTRAPVMVIKGIATWLSWTEAEVSTQETGIWPQATSICSLYPIQVSL